jgi:hypothetical protein
MWRYCEHLATIVISNHFGCVLGFWVTFWVQIRCMPLDIMLFVFNLNKQALHFHLLTVQPCFFHQSPSKAFRHFIVFLRQFLHNTTSIMNTSVRSMYGLIGRDLLLWFMCCYLCQVVEDACTNLLPNVLCEYLYNLSEMFTRFYTNCQVHFPLFPSLKSSGVWKWQHLPPTRRRDKPVTCLCLAHEI